LPEFESALSTTEKKNEAIEKKTTRKEKERAAKMRAPEREERSRLKERSEPIGKRESEGGGGVGCKKKKRKKEETNMKEDDERSEMKTGERESLSLRSVGRTVGRALPSSLRPAT